jgi:hypothetical protein
LDFLALVDAAVPHAVIAVAERAAIAVARTTASKYFILDQHWIKT